MFGVGKEQLVKALCRISARSCGYIGHRCDCKYMQDSEADEYVLMSGETSGCPETRMAATLLNTLTTQEFYALAARAGIQVSLPEEKEVNISSLMTKFQDDRRANMIRTAALAPPKKSRKSAKKHIITDANSLKNYLEKTK
jgi:hypothetical protein